MSHPDPDLLQTAPVAARPAHTPDAVFCLPHPLDGTTSAGPTLHFFRGGEYFCWDVVAETLLPGYPRPIATDWPGLEAAGAGRKLRGALHVPAWGEQVFFLFEGDPEAVAWDLGARRIAGRRTVQSLLPSALTRGDFTPVAAQLADGTPVVYAFAKYEYTRWTVGGGLPAGEDPGFPRRIDGDWKEGLTLGPRAGVYVDWPSRSSAHSNRKIYFFMGNLYLRWDVPSHSRNYRLDIVAGWKGWPMPAAVAPGQG